MARRLISFDNDDRSGLEQKAKEIAASMPEAVHQAVRQAQHADRKPMNEVLATTKGLWRKGDGLKYQLRVRREWR
jgi:hypothetical protein